ncbi:hypothetical protein [Legionella hackeliae]|uniref:Uncharacterized protein n=1 Tax=Legionella hackeliae TaxID=449 RepID=A0A0A8URX1_LEGHA|nr:hypothetical protein [Legionella hackeliae]KTD13203.1 hypothetical protein Lhac_1072 [Legionella hackeliae]CEK11483.1 protein of unknown function [Legionella hackeliae]STX48252.1 Uncharacterised protein [Legionella hackeliae]
MSKYGTKFKTINTHPVTPLDEIIAMLGQTENLEFEQLDLEQLEQPNHPEQIESISHNRNSIFYNLNHNQYLDNAVLITMLSGILIFTASLCSQHNAHAIMGLAVTLAAFFLRVAIDIMGEFMENNNGSYVYQSHYWSGR